jgi:hypothetical protein
MSICKRSVIDTAYAVAPNVIAPLCLSELESVILVADRDRPRAPHDTAGVRRSPLTLSSGPVTGRQSWQLAGRVLGIGRRGPAVTNLKGSEPVAATTGASVCLATLTLHFLSQLLDRATDRPQPSGRCRPGPACLLGITGSL